MQCLLESVYRLIGHTKERLVAQLGHDGKGRGYNIFEITDYILQFTDFKPVVIERDVRSDSGELLNADLTLNYWDLPIPKVVFTVEPKPHAVAMFRDGSVYDILKRGRCYTDEELEELKNKHFGLMLLY